METRHKLTEANLNIRNDIRFIESILQSNDAEAGSEVMRYLLDLSYTLARNELMEARRFANLCNKTYVDVKDLRVAKMDKSDDFDFGPFLLCKSIVQPLPSPTATTSLLLPPWRNCQVGANAELKQILAEVDSMLQGEVAPPPCKIPRMRMPNQSRPY